MRVNRKLNCVPVSHEELRPGNMIYCWGVKICGELAKDPQHFIITDINRATGYLLLEWAGELPFLVKNPAPTPPYYLDKIKTVIQDVFHQEEVHISKIRGVELWGSTMIHDARIKGFGFIAHPGGVYTLDLQPYQVKVIDTLFRRESVSVVIYSKGQVKYRGELWYVHELQNIVFQETGIELENSLTRRIMVDRPRPNTLPQKNDTEEHHKTGASPV